MNMAIGREGKSNKFGMGWIKKTMLDRYGGYSESF